MASVGGLDENLGYEDLRHLDWAGFDVVFREEPELLSRLSAGEDLCDDTGAYETLALGLDPGVASTVVALAALGCPPLTSCSGGPGHREEHPLVVFWCPHELFEDVFRAAQASGVDLEGVLHPGLMAFAGSGQLGLMREFAAQLASFRPRTR